MKTLTKEKIKAPLFSVLAVLLYIAFTVLLALVPAVLLPEEKYMEVFFFTDPIAMIGACAVMCHVLKKRKGIRFRDSLRLKNFDFSVPVMLLLFSWGCSEVCDGITAYICSGFMTVEPNSGMSGVIGIIHAVLIAPVLEEVLFRFLGTEFSRGIYRLPVICIANGIFFSLMHGYNVQGFVNVFVGGVLAAYVYMKTGNILYLMLEHAMHNALCLIDFGSINLLGSPIYTEKNGFVLSSPQWFVLNIIIMAVCIVWYFKVFRKKYTVCAFDEMISESAEAAAIGQAQKV